MKARLGERKKIYIFCTWLTNCKILTSLLSLPLQLQNNLWAHEHPPPCCKRTACLTSSLLTSILRQEKHVIHIHGLSAKLWKVRHILKAFKAFYRCHTEAVFPLRDMQRFVRDCAIQGEAQFTAASHLNREFFFLPIMMVRLLTADHCSTIIFIQRHAHWAHAIKQSQNASYNKTPSNWDFNQEPTFYDETAELHVLQSFTFPF